MAKRLTKRKQKQMKIARKRFLLDFALSFFVIIAPVIALILYAFGVDIPKIAMGIYSSVAFVAAGTLFIVFTALEKLGFGKAGLYFSRFGGFKQLTKEEGKENTYVFGGLLVALGILFAVLTIIYR